MGGGPSLAPVVLDGSENGSLLAGEGGGGPGSITGAGAGASGDTVECCGAPRPGRAVGSCIAGGSGAAGAAGKPACFTSAVGKLVEVVVTGGRTGAGCWSGTVTAVVAVVVVLLGRAANSALVVAGRVAWTAAGWVLQLCWAV
jgi:hypothetical protein